MNFYLDKPVENDSTITINVYSRDDIRIGYLTYYTDGYKFGDIRFMFVDTFPVIWDNLRLDELNTFSMIFNDVSFLMSVIKRSEVPEKTINVLTKMYGKGE